MQLRTADLAPTIEQVVDWLKTRGKCKRVEVVGAIRRGRQRVDQVELLAANAALEQLDAFLVDIAWDERVHLVPTPGTPWTVRQFVHCASGVPFRVHFCDWQAWWTYLVITTGPEKYVAKLRRQAAKQGQKLTPGGVLDRRGRLRRPRSELGVYRLCRVRWVHPAERAA